VTDHTRAQSTPAPTSPSAVLRHALISPFHNSENPYIELQKQLLAAAGFRVSPLSVRELFRGGLSRALRPENLLVFHWLEIRPYAGVASRKRLDPRGCAEFCFYAALIALSRARSVYFVHNHAVHDTEGWRRALSVRLIAFLRRLSSESVVHDPRSAAELQARYLPHPLYWANPNAAPLSASRAGLAAVARATSAPRSRPRFGILGAIRPYKGIAELLSVWPADSPLSIAGKGSEQYLSRLRELIERRGLSSTVLLEPGFLSDSEFDAKLDELDVLVLPHVANSMLVSGAFFEAIGRVPRIVARSTPFMRWAESQFRGVRCFARDEELPALISGFDGEWPEENVDADWQRASELFGWDACVAAYRDAFAGDGA
jgi:glycosyltransferase involved in cell wall biosynthesis